MVLKAKKIIIGLVVIILVVVAAVALISMLRIGIPQPLVEEFEPDLGDTNFGDWTANSDVPADPNNPGSSVQWHIRRVSNVSRSGNHSAEFFIDGRQDDGTIWLERKINVLPNAQVRFTLSFFFYSEQESFNTLAAIVAYAGSAEPATEEDFTVIGNANEVAGWKNYVFNPTLNTDSSGEAYVALGISVRWETYMTYYIDDIVID